MLQKFDKNLLLRKLNIYVPAQNPLGLMNLNAILGQNSVNVAEFTKQYNFLSKDYLNDVILNVEISIYADKKFTVLVKRPTSAFLILEEILNAQNKKINLENVVNSIKLTDLYKISFFINKVNNNELTAKSIFKSLLATLNTMHIKIDKDL